VSDASKFNGFEEWSRVVREPLIWLGLPDPVLSVEHGYREDPLRLAARMFLDWWRVTLRLDNSFTAKKVFETLRDGWETDDSETYNVLLARVGGDRHGNMDPKWFPIFMRDLRDQVHWLDEVKDPVTDEIRHEAGDYRLIVAVESNKGHEWQLQSRREDGTWPPKPEPKKKTDGVGHKLMFVTNGW
jgi:hypothetical protein